MDISTLRRDAAAIEAGAWVSEIPGFDDLRMKVRGLTSATVRDVKTGKERIATKEDRDWHDNLKDAAIQRILGELLCEAVLMDWQGVTNNGKALPYGLETAKKYIQDPDYVLFRNAVIWAASQVDKLPFVDLEPDKSANAETEAAA